MAGSQSARGWALPGAAFAAVAVLYLAGFLEPLERRLMDLRFEWLGRQASGDLVVISIDPASLQVLDTWPWPRGYHATVLDNLLDAGARRVAFDVDFSSRSFPDEDRELEKALARAGHGAILPVFVQWVPGPDDVPRLIATEPLPELARHVTLASINIQPDSDGLARRYPGATVVGERLLPSLAAALAGAAPTGNASFLVDFGIDPATVPRLSYVDILTGQFDPTAIDGRNVIIGATAVELGDHMAVPRLAAVPGVLLQGLAFESLHQERVLQRTGALATLAGSALLCLLCGPTLLRHSWRWGLGLLAAPGAVLLLLAFSLQKLAPVIIDVFPPLLGLVGCYGLGLLSRIDRLGFRLLTQEHHLERNQVLMHEVMKNSFDGIVTLDRSGKVEICNPAVATMFGRQVNEIVGQPLSLWLQTAAVSEGDGDDLREASEAVGVRKDGSTFPLELLLSDVRTAESCLRVGLLRDITERHTQRAALEHQATHDALTGLPNRVLLNRRLETALERARESGSSLAVLLLDLDGFKEVNDTLGHHMGDRLLRKIGERLQPAQGCHGTVARLGGDEFAVLLPDTDVEQAAETGRRLLAILDDPFNVEDLVLRIGASVGVAMHPDHGASSSVLLQRADVAMYVAKKAHTGLSVYDADKDDHNRRQLTLMADLRTAIDAEDLVLHYQPKISCADERLLGVEALARWRHPEHGRVSPDTFIPLAEATGLIKPLTDVVLTAACRQHAAWRRQGLRLPMSVNLSVHSLTDADLPGQLMEILCRWGMEPRDLTLEITESVLMEEPEQSLKIASQLEEMGIGISIDDFGTGYSSLAYLKKLPAGELKIDKSFILHMDSNPDDVTIVRSTIELAHNLGRRVVAEGIESPAVWSRLRQLGCDAGQGFLFSRPLPAEALARWCRARRLPGTHVEAARPAPLSDSL